MARSDVATLIPLDRAARILGIDPYHFNSIVTSRRPEKSSCDDIWFQYAEQRIGQASRYDLSVALSKAEEQTAEYLGYYPMPTWIEGEDCTVTRPFAVELTNRNGINSMGRAKSIRTQRGFVVETGSRAKTLIEANRYYS